MEQTDAGGVAGPVAPPDEALFDAPPPATRAPRKAAKKATKAAPAKKAAPPKATKAATKAAAPAKKATTAQTEPRKPAGKKATKKAAPAAVVEPAAVEEPAAVVDAAVVAEEPVAQESVEEPVPQETVEDPRATPEPAEPEAIRPAPVAEARPAEPAPPVREADFGHRLALAAVREWGPTARRWVEETRNRYPTAGSDALARLAIWQFGRTGRRSAISAGASRLVGAVTASGALAREQAQLALTIAAAYGLDPTHPQRAEELIAILRPPGFHRGKAKAVARTASILAGLATRMAGARLVPFGASAVAAVQASRGAVTIGDRARDFYRNQAT